MNICKTLPYNGQYETVAASQTAQVLGVTGAATATTTIIDGSTSIVVFPNSPGGGIGTYNIPLGMVSVTGPWKVTTGAGVAAIAVGKFSA